MSNNTPSLTKEAQKFDALGINDVTEGIRTAARLDTIIREKEEEQKNKVTETVKQETPVVTPQDIRDEMYR